MSCRAFLSREREKPQIWLPGTRSRDTEHRRVLTCSLLPRVLAPAGPVQELNRPRGVASTK